MDNLKTADVLQELSERNKSKIPENKAKQKEYVRDYFNERILPLLIDSANNGYSYRYIIVRELNWAEKMTLLEILDEECLEYGKWTDDSWDLTKRGAYSDYLLFDNALKIRWAEIKPLPHLKEKYNKWKLAKELESD